MTRREELEAMIAQHARDLGEHFDSVRIIATVANLSEDGTEMKFSAGSGSLYAQQGSVRELLVMWEEFTREHARKIQREGS